MWPRDRRATSKAKTVEAEGRPQREVMEVCSKEERGPDRLQRRKCSLFFDRASFRRDFQRPSEKDAPEKSFSLYATKSLKALSNFADAHLGWLSTQVGRRQLSFVIRALAVEPMSSVFKEIGVNEEGFSDECWTWEEDWMVYLPDNTTDEASHGWPPAHS
jgi:hypothetical protein